LPVRRQQEASRKTTRTFDRRPGRLAPSRFCSPVKAKAEAPTGLWPWLGLTCGAAHRSSIISRLGTGTPERPEDLSHHKCLLFALQPADAWYFHRPGEDSSIVEVKVRGDLRANDSEALLQAARDALGIALLPTWLLEDDLRAGRLVTLLPGWDCAIAQGPERAIWGIYPPKKTVSPKVRAFLDFIAERFGKPPYWDRGLG
jgi:DNA-binding transcriptional LysR family regulator